MLPRPRIVIGALLLVTITLPVLLHGRGATARR